MKTLILVSALTLSLFSVTAHADCERVLHGTTMTLFGHENLYDVECDGEPSFNEDRGIQGIEAADKRVELRQREHDRDQRDSEALGQANEAAKLDQQARESEDPISN